MFLKNLFKKSYPRLDWIQVEVSSFCDGKCIYCPHTIYCKNWQSRMLPVELFKKLIPAFKKTNLVYLQGWGEPFTHPDFTEFLRIAKKSGCMVGTTTNGMMLDHDKISELIDEGIDIIGFSLAGIDEKNDSIRKGTRIDKVLRCIDEIHRIKESKSVDNPRIHIAYMLLKSGIKDIDKLPSFFENAGIDQAVISSLSFVADKFLNNETLSVETDLDILKMGLKNVESDFIRRRLSAVARQEPVYMDIALNIVSPQMKESRCSENIERALVVGSDGSISPCVMGLIPVSGENYYYFKGNKQKLEKLVFGNISEELLNIIWYKKEYRDFLQTHKHRDGFETRLYNSCNYCNKRFIVDCL